MKSSVCLDDFALRQLLLKGILLLSAMLIAICSACSTQKENQPATERSNLSIEAQMIYTSGGPQPVARDTFYLFDKDVLDVKVPKGQVINTQPDFAKLSGAQQTMFLLEGYEEVQQFADQRHGLVPRGIREETFTTLKAQIEVHLMADKEASPHFVQKMMTDFQGRAEFENLKPGDYWILGITQTRSGFAIWNLKVTPKPGQNKVLMDQNNALFAR